MTKIFLYATNITGFNEMFKVADRLLNNEKFNLTFVINSDFEGNFKQVILEKINSIKAKYIGSADIEKQYQKPIVKQTASDYFRLKLLQFGNSFGKFNKVKYHLLRKKKESSLAAFTDFVEKENPDLLIIPEDGPGANFQLLKAFKESGKKILVIPYEYSGYLQLLYGAKLCFKYKKEDYGSKYHYAFDKYLFPDGGFYYGLMELEEYLALEKCNLLPLNVKTVHGGIADAIAVESEMMMSHYLNEKLQNKKLTITGSLSDDTLVKNLKQKQVIKQKLEQKLKEEIKKPIVLFSFIPDSPYDTKKVFEQYHDYILFVTQQLGTLKNYKVIYQFHPAVSKEKREVFTKTGLPLIEIPTEELMAITDLYMTSYSSTIRWAIACKTPVVNFDIYNFKFEDFNMCKGVVNIRSKNEFAELMDSINKNDKFMEDLKAIQEADSEKWSRLDGRSGERILNLIEDLCKH